jgi:hypothetical protein
MEKYEQSLESAKKNLQLADHMLNVTYKVVNDPKLLLSIIGRISTALNNNLAFILHYERLYKRIPPFKEDFESMFNAFKLRVTKRYNINIEYITLIQEINEILKQHKNSAVEFRKDNKFVICSDKYRLKIISVDHIKRYINKAKVFLRETENMVKKNE